MVASPALQRSTISWIKVMGDGDAKFEVISGAAAADILDFAAGQPDVKLATRERKLERTTSSKFFNVSEQFWKMSQLYLMKN